MRLHESVKYLIKSFNHDAGLPVTVYIATRCLINELWGIAAENVFMKYIDSVGGRYHLKEGQTENCLRNMFSGELGSKSVLKEHDRRAMEGALIATISLFDADPECEHDMRDAPGGGIKCTKCRGWFCF